MREASRAAIAITLTARGQVKLGFWSLPCVAHAGVASWTQDYYLHERQTSFFPDNSGVGIISEHCTSPSPKPHRTQILTP